MMVNSLSLAPLGAAKVDGNPTLGGAAVGVSGLANVGHGVGGGMLGQMHHVTLPLVPTPPELGVGNVLQGDIAGVGVAQMELMSTASATTSPASLEEMDTKPLIKSEVLDEIFGRMMDDDDLECAANVSNNWSRVCKGYLNSARRKVSM